MYVAVDNTIQKFDSKGTFITKWGSMDNNPLERGYVGQFDSPSGIAIDSSDNVYVADTGNQRIQVFAPTT